MNQKQKDQMYQQIEKHGNNLISFFNLPADTDPVKLCKKLHSLEINLNRVMCNLCNTNNVQGIDPGRVNGVWHDAPETSEEDQDKLFEAFEKKLYRIIGKDNADKVFFNHDPRGYSLKIKEENSKEFTGHKDWGGYGILAPDFSN